MNTDNKNEDREEARAALDQARADHARALLALQDDPTDPQGKQQMRQAVREGRSAWKGYQKAATAGLAAEIEAITPSVFREAK